MEMAVVERGEIHGGRGGEGEEVEGGKESERKERVRATQRVLYPPGPR